MRASDLKLVQAVDDGSDIAAVCRVSQALLDLTISANAVRFTAVLTQSTGFVAQLTAVIGEAESIANAVNIADMVTTAQATERRARIEEIKRQLQILIGSFPNSSKQDLSIFGVALLEDVVAEQPTIAALTNACRHLRKTVNFVPTIAEVLRALALETERLRSQIQDVEQFSDRLTRARSCKISVRDHISRGFEKSVLICIGRQLNGDNCSWISVEVRDEAQRRIAAAALDDATAAQNRERLKRLTDVQRLPKKIVGGRNDRQQFLQRSLLVNWSAPPEIAEMHPVVDGWYRRGPWIKSRKGEHFEALYMRNGESRHVVVPQNVACDAAASLWAVRHVVKARRKSASRSGAGRRARSAARQGATGEDGTKPAKDSRETTGDR